MVVGREHIPGGNTVLVNLMNQERALSRVADDQIGASEPRSEMTKGGGSLVGALAGQGSMACSNISRDSLQVLGSSLSHDR